MTTIRYNTDKGWITLRATGHAGNDAVCTAVSTLTQCLGMYAVTHGGEESKVAGSIIISMRDNRMTREVAEAVNASLVKLAEQYPEHIKIA